ncbi:MAG: ABC transporter ATP-binding protein, partial [Desulfobacterales bacterium]|nr:ABC transporter ATP-binding protein [Desulfobacterales bacterium]
MKTYFFTEKGVVKAIDGINLEIGQHETLGLVGESGSGKSVTALSIMRLVPHPGRIVEGQVLLEGDDLLKKTKEDMIQVRGCRMSMIFQDPTSSLNPVLNVGEQIGEVIRLHGRTEDESDTRKRIIEILEEVGIPDASTRHRHYPHQLS